MIDYNEMRKKCPAKKTLLKQKSNQAAVKAIAREIGYADDMKAYKASPEDYRGNVADVSMFLRVAITGKANAPDLYTVMQILGKEATVARLERMMKTL